MKIKADKNSKYLTRDGYHYLTKRRLLSKAQSAGKAAAKSAMETMGYVVTVVDGYVVKRYKDGKAEQIQKLESL